MSSSVINTSSPSNLKKNPQSAKKSKALTRDFFSQLIKLEADFHNKLYTVSTLDELIQNYAKAVEYYDSIKDEISSYFMFKIQDILATKRSLKMLFDQNRTGGRKGTDSVPEKEQAPTGSNVEDKLWEAPSNKIETKEAKKEIGDESSGDEDEDMHISEVERKRRARKKADRNMRVSISLMKNEKQRFFNFYYKMETQKVNEKLNMNVLMDTFEKSSDKNDEFIKKDVDHQRERLRKRLEKRVTENFASQTSSNVGRGSNAALANWEEHREIEQTEMIRQSIIQNWESEGAKILEVDSHSSGTENNLDDFHDPIEESSPPPNKVESHQPANQENNFAGFSNSAHNEQQQEDDEPDVI